MASFESRLAAEDMLHHFCQRAAAASDRGELERVLEEAYEADGLYAFGELLDVAPVRKCPELQTKLRLFAYGCCCDVPAAVAAGAAPLTPKQLVKLQELTLAALVRDRQEKAVPYRAIQDALGVADVRAFEDIIIDAIYHRLSFPPFLVFFTAHSHWTWWTDVVAGKLDQERSTFTIERSIGRDVQPERVPALLATLQDWFVFFFSPSSFCPSVFPLSPPYSDRQKRCSALVEHADMVVREGGAAAVLRAADPTAMSDTPVATN